MNGAALVWTVVFIFVAAFCCGLCACHALKRKKNPNDYADDSGTGSTNHFSLFGPSYGNRSHENAPTNEREIYLQNQELVHKKAMHDQQIAHDRQIYAQEVAHKEEKLQMERQRHQEEIERSQREKDRRATQHAKNDHAAEHHPPSLPSSAYGRGNSFVSNPVHPTTVASYRGGSNVVPWNHQAQGGSHW